MTIFDQKSAQNLEKRQNSIFCLVAAAAAVAVVFTLPAGAQNATPPATPSTAQVQTGTSTNAELGKYDSQYATGQPLQTKSHEGFWGHLNPLARKKWVNRQVTPVKDRLNELDQLSATNSQQIKDLDAR
ncbi:MAG TPA: hypothetical protein VMU62_08725, partial [Acidobacteriaceae bacterium]|nr:hypothetical protein [Acidobacteriaceae bacterium]